MKRIASRYPLFADWETLLLLCIAFSLCQSSLTGAFAYEFSFILGIFAFLICAVGSSIRFTLIERTRPICRDDFIRAGVSSILLLTWPLFLILMNSIRVPVCRMDTGFLWYFLLPFPSALFGAASAAWGHRRQFSALCSIFQTLLPMFLFSAITLKDIYFHPPLSFLHPAFGFYAGPMYDEWIPIRKEIVLYRAWTLFLAGGLFGMAWLTRLGRGHLKNAFYCLFLTPLIAFPFVRASMSGFHNTTSVQLNLGGRAQGQHVHFFYDPKTLNKEDVSKWLTILDYRVETVSSTLQLESGQIPNVDVYLYGTEKQKFDLTGVRTVAIGNPMQLALHLPAGSDPRSTLIAHELTHVLAAPYGIPGIGLTLRVGLLEGLATAVERYRGDLSLHEWAAAMRRMSLLPDLSSILDPVGFFHEPPMRAYLAAGSFCRWLIDQYGMRRFLRLYRNGNVELIYGMNLTALVKQWESRLNATPLTSESLKKAETSLKAKAIFERKCPHDVADATGRANRLATDHDWDSAITLLKQAEEYSDSAPNILVDLAQTLKRAGRYDESKKTAARLRERESSLSYYDGISAQLMGDNSLLAGERKCALEHYQDPKMDNLAGWLKESLRLRQELATTGNWERLVGLATGKNPSTSEHDSWVERRQRFQRWGWAREALNANARAAELERNLPEAVASYREMERIAPTEGSLLLARDQAGLAAALLQH